jgi:hypothetical protein
VLPRLSPGSGCKPYAVNRVVALIVVGCSALLLQACHPSYIIANGERSLNDWDERRLAERVSIGKTTLADAEAMLGTCADTNITLTEPLTADATPETGARWCSWTYQRGRGYRDNSIVFPAPPNSLQARKQITFVFNKETKVVESYQLEVLNPHTKVTRTVNISAQGRWVDDDPKR